MNREKSDGGENKERISSLLFDVPFSMLIIVSQKFYLAGVIALINICRRRKCLFRLVQKQAFNEI